MSFIFIISRWPSGGRNRRQCRKVVRYRATIVVVPSHEEAFGIVAIEAMAAARPVVAFGSDDAARALGADNAALLAEQPATSALERLAGDAYLRRSIGAANRERAEAERDEGAMIAAYRRLYSSAIGRDAL